MEKSAQSSSPADRNVFVPHAYPERTVDLGEVTMKYAVSGSPGNPALLLIPGQTESWWGFEAAMQILEKDFQVYAVDLRGQGRSTWTPRRYSLDNMGNDLVRFIALAIKRPVIVSGNSSGGVLRPGSRRSPCRGKSAASMSKTHRSSHRKLVRFADRRSDSP